MLFKVLNGCGLCWNCRKSTQSVLQIQCSTGLQLLPPLRNNSLCFNICLSPHARPCLPQHIARPRLVPIVAAVSEPSPGATLIELDAVYVLTGATIPGLAPITWLLPGESASNVHMKIVSRRAARCAFVHCTLVQAKGCVTLPCAFWGGVVSYK